MKSPLTYYTFDRLQKYILSWTLALLLFILFVPALRIPFLADDYIWIAEIMAYDTAAQFFQETFAFKETDFRYRPLMPTGVWTCYQISGYTPFCMHLVSFILHFFNTLLIGNLGYLLTKNKWSAWGTAFFFAVYFPHVVTVVWISDLGNVLALFFMLLTVTFFWLAMERSTYLWGGISLITFALAMISKESALALGPILVIWGTVIVCYENFTSDRRIIATFSIGYILLTMTYIFLVNQTGLVFAFSGQGNYTYHFDLNAVRNFFFYSLNFVWPTHVHTIEIVYQGLTDIFRVHAGNEQAIISNILTIPAIAWIVGGPLLIWGYVVWLLWKREMVTVLTLVWISVGILPVLFLAGHGERHMYVASAGLSLLVGHMFLGAFSRTQLSSTMGIITAMLFVLVLTLNFYWSQQRINRWHMAGKIAHEIVSVISSHSATFPTDAELLFVKVPLSLNGAYLFELGLEAALELGTGVPNLTVQRLAGPDDLPRTIESNQFVFMMIDNRLVDLTADYRSVSP